MSTEVDLRGLAIDRGDSGSSRVRPRRHVVTRYVLPGVLIVGFLALVTWAAWDLLFPPKPVTVVPVLSTTAEVRREGTPLFKAAGWVEPRPTPVRVAALAPGVVESLLVVEDQPVGKGDAIAELVEDDARLALDGALADAKLREAELDEAVAKLEAAKIRLDQPVHLKAALGEAEASLAKIETLVENLPFEIRRAEADLGAARADHAAKVASRGVVPGVQIDIAKGKLDAALARVDELRRREASLLEERAALAKRRDALETQLELLADETEAKQSAEAKVKSARARVEQAGVAGAEARLQLERMTVRSPIAGRVYKLIGHPGASLGRGKGAMQGHDGSTVVTLYRPDMLQVRVDVRFEDIPRVELKQPVRIENAALAEPLTGEVLFVSSEADIQKNTLQVKVAIPNPPAVLKPEMLVDVTFLAPKRASDPATPTREMRLYLPEELVHQGEGGSFVWLADLSDSVARRRVVKTGAASANGLVEITDGLTPASRVVASGGDGLEDGDRIRVTGEDSTAGAKGLPRGAE